MFVLVLKERNSAMVGSRWWRSVYTEKSFLASRLICNQTNSVCSFCQNQNTTGTPSDCRPTFVLLFPLLFFSVCVRLQSKFCELWSKSSIFHLPASVQHRQLSLKSVSLTASWPAMSAAAKSHTTFFFSLSVRL